MRRKKRAHVPVSRREKRRIRKIGHEEGGLANLLEEEEI
jgi:hypothetical protein